ncbi:unnamed protein product [Cylindrotheca closterium]|uniref:Uncharacterized protein n=1 Tax=Cylindrotheca closterium TaxID=2856 RepID=A0AAD2FLN9_9STRA|nr:unnamed protein product [Cylindrotheca closterium]
MCRVLFQGPLFGRLTKAGRDYLLKNGWQVLLENNNDDADNFNIAAVPLGTQRLGFVWPTKTGPQFQIDDATAAHIRPFPKHMTDIFDDKLQLAEALKGTTLAPPCLLQPLVPKTIDPQKLYFVKHRYGAQGKSVYVYSKDDLLAWHGRSQNPQEFVIQEEILPALHEGRKFVLRCHLLLVQNRDGNNDIHGSHGSHDIPSTVAGFVHKTSIICQHHTTRYQKGISEKSSQVSQAGKKHPAPILFQDLPSDHPCANAYDQIFHSCQTLCSTVPISSSGTTNATTTTTPPPTSLAPETTCFGLFGLDLMMDSDGDIKVCEVNSHPALGWGTMSKVPQEVFERLIEETLSLLLQNSDPEYAESNFDKLGTY